MVNALIVSIAIFICPLNKMCYCLTEKLIRVDSEIPISLKDQLVIKNNGPAFFSRILESIGVIRQDTFNSY